MYIFFEENQ